MKTEQMAGAVLSLNSVPNKIPINILIINMGNWLINRSIIAPKDINSTFDIIDIIKADKTHITVCNSPIMNPTSEYPSIKSIGFIGEEYNLLRKNDCLSFDTKRDIVSIINV